MKKIIISVLVLVVLNSCSVISLVDGVASSIIDIFVYHEKTEQLYQFTTEVNELELELDSNKFFYDDEGRCIVSYDDLPNEYRSLLVKK